MYFNTLNNLLYVNDFNNVFLQDKILIKIIMRLAKT